MRRNDFDFVVFSFATPEDAEVFCERFDGEHLAPLPGHPDDSGLAMPLVFCSHQRIPKSA